MYGSIKFYEPQMYTWSVHNLHHIPEISASLLRADDVGSREIVNV
jgi:hypothetical protein